MRLPDKLARFNRHVTNPIQRLWAGRLPGFGIIEHVGRRTGTTYRTPVNVYRLPDGFVVVLFYGAQRDWVRNLRAAGGGRLVHRGRRLRITEPTVVPSLSATDLLPHLPALLVKRLRVENVLQLREA
ncbi:MAG: nitroreductase family deazaflavin-dependent oxidoreductase [Pseudonocardiaceae bacterium]|nr:nitroreductase family deazaflavin-dependent oxidoreductase [Pseudonocardiaceae bacterium]